MTKITLFLRFSFLHEQADDESCGLSVVLSILDLYLNVKTNETELIDLLRVDLQEEKQVTMDQMIQVFENYYV
ncbi:hypothetical protein [Treponema phagedenis]|uniref:hypothetical protein n=1 Tax=Treponema phagedenis TaxID=162 RepID=UPI0011E70259|nr:hypothetical protein [Treponema phagedenis]QEK02627.1 hypothetical protein FUT83_01605 [Treponema phagedenis]